MNTIQEDFVKAVRDEVQYQIDNYGYSIVNELSDEEIVKHINNYTPYDIAIYIVGDERML